MLILSSKGNHLSIGNHLGVSPVLGDVPCKQGASPGCRDAAQSVGAWLSCESVATCSKVVD